MLLGFLVAAAFVPMLTGAALPTGWVVIWAAAPVLMWNTTVPRDLFEGWGWLFLGYAALSWCWSAHGTLELLSLLSLAGVAVWASQHDLRPVVIGLACGLLVSDVVALGQWLGTGLVPYNAGLPAGLFMNSDLFSEASVVVLVLLLIERLYVYIPFVLPGLLVSSRAVMLGLLLLVVRAMWPRHKVIVGVTCLLGSALVAYAAIYHSNSMEQRLDIWRDTLAGLTWFGHGVGSFQYLFPVHAAHVDTLMQRPVYAHSDLLQLTFDLGLGAVFPMLLLVSLLGVEDDYQSALVLLLALAAFGFPLHMPVTAFVGALVAGRLASVGLEYRNSWIVGGSIACMGMAGRRPEFVDIGFEGVPVPEGYCGRASYLFRAEPGTSDGSPTSHPARSGV